MLGVDVVAVFFCRDPLSGEPTKSFRNIGKLRRDRTFVRVSQENMGRNWGVLLGTKWGYIKEPM